MEKICLRCGKKFFKPYTESKKAWINRHIYCSVKCRYPEPTIRKCQFCGRKFHKKYGNKNNTKGQLMEFLDQTNGVLTIA